MLGADIVAHSGHVTATDRGRLLGQKAAYLNLQRIGGPQAADRNSLFASRRVRGTTGDCGSCRGR